MEQALNEVATNKFKPLIQDAAISFSCDKIMGGNLEPWGITGLLGKELFFS